MPAGVRGHVTKCTTYSSQVQLPCFLANGYSAVAGAISCPALTLCAPTGIESRRPQVSGKSGVTIQHADCVSVMLSVLRDGIPIDVEPTRLNECNGLHICACDIEVQCNHANRQGHDQTACLC